MKEIDNKVRLDVLLRLWGTASKKETKELVAQRAIKVNGEIADDASQLVEPKSIIEVNGCKVVPVERVIYMLNKPSGYVCVRGNDLYPSVFELMKDIPYCDQLICVGRLDEDTRGLLLLTTDGRFSESITRPEAEIEKCYEIETDRRLPDNAGKKLANGMEIDSGVQCRPAELIRCDDKTYTMTVTEGKRHEVKRLIKACGAKVKRLKRLRIGQLELGDLKEGMYRTLDVDEEQKIFMKRK